MASSRPGIFGQIWQSIKKSIVIYRTKDIFVGTDHNGNKYFERLEDPLKGLKRQRRVQPLDPDQFKVPKVPVEWMTWLQGRRLEPPTEEEIEKNEVMSIRTQMRAAELAKQKMAEDKVNEEEPLPVQPSQKKQSFPIYSEYEITPGDKRNKHDP